MMPIETPILPRETHARMLRRGDTSSALLFGEVAEFAPRWPMLVRLALKFVLSGLCWAAILGFVITVAALVHA